MAAYTAHVVAEAGGIVRKLLTQSSGFPLDSRLRSFFGARFGCDLSRVRVHTGLAAQEAAAALAARAFTVGCDVVFADGEYRPETPSGRWLLAHELAHVVQQQDAFDRASDRIGLPTDPAEREADEAADRTLAGLRVPFISRSGERVLRRAVRIDASTAGIDIIAGQARPALALLHGASGPVAVANLTKNFNSDPTKVDWAFDFLGHVNVALGPSDTLAGFTFGFVQYLRHNFTGLFYAGRRPREGSIGMLLDPVITNAYLLDCSPVTTRPFMWPPAKFAQFNGGEQTATMGDHPVLSIKQRELNVLTGVENYLFHIVDDRDAWSMFTVFDRTGKFQHLAHVHWTLRYEFRLKWRGGSPVVENRSRFAPSPAVRGAPTDAALHAALSVIGPAQSPIANDQARLAMRTVLLPPNPHRSDNPGWFNNVPFDFFA